jgi:hypothetical protein
MVQGWGVTGRPGKKEKTMKKINAIGWSFFAFLFFMSIYRECMAGVAIEQVVRNREGNPSKVFLYFSGSKFRTDHLEGGLTTIIDFQGDQMMMIDHRSKHYVEVKFTQWEKEVAERLKKSSPDIKAKPRKITVKKTDERAIVSGFRTEKVQIFADGELIEENWVTRDVEMREVEKVMEKVALGFSKEFKIEMKEGREIYEKLKPYGYPVLVKDYTVTHGLGGLNVLEVLRMEKKELKDEVFLPPNGYQRIVPEPSRK